MARSQCKVSRRAADANDPFRILVPGAGIHRTEQQRLNQQVLKQALLNDGFGNTDPVVPNMEHPIDGHSQGLTAQRRLWWQPPVGMDMKVGLRAVSGVAHLAQEITGTTVGNQIDARPR